MPSKKTNIIALSAVLVLAALHPTSAARPQRNLRRQKRNKRKARRGQISHVDATDKKDGGLEEDVEFWTNMARRTQDMSVPGPTPTMPPVIVDPTDPPVGDGGGDTGGGPAPTLPPIVVDPTPPPVPVVGPTPSGPPQPIVALICAAGEPCTTLGDICSDGSTEECCGETFDSFVCECLAPNGAPLVFGDCKATEACTDKVCTTDPPAPGPPATPEPTVPQAGGFVCPDLNLCTAVDPANPVNECPVVGEPCPDGNPGEFCCLDSCPRRYCTAKQGVAMVVKKASIEEIVATTTQPPLTLEHYSRD